MLQRMVLIACLALVLTRHELGIAPKERTLQDKHIVFDVGGVLCDVKRIHFTAKLAGSIKGFLKLVMHRLLEGRNLKKVTFNYLEKEFGLQRPPSGNLHCAADQCLAPQIMCNWLASCDLQAEGLASISSADFIALACSRADTSPHLTSKRERKLVKRLIRSMFDPHVLAHSMAPIEAAIPLIAACAQTSTLHILSNYSADGFDALVAQPHTASIFDHFERCKATATNPSIKNALVSGYVHTIKPYKSIYEKLKAHLIASDATLADSQALRTRVVIVDDQIENVLAARLAGFTALWLSNGDYARLEEELRDLGFIN